MENTCEISLFALTVDARLILSTSSKGSKDTQLCWVLIVSEELVFVELTLVVKSMLSQAADLESHQKSKKNSFESRDISTKHFLIANPFWVSFEFHFLWQQLLECHLCLCKIPG